MHIETQPAVACLVSTFFISPISKNNAIVPSGLRPGVYEVTIQVDQDTYDAGALPVR